MRRDAESLLETLLLVVDAAGLTPLAIGFARIGTVGGYLAALGCLALIVWIAREWRNR